MEYISPCTRPWYSLRFNDRRDFRLNRRYHKGSRIAVRRKDRTLCSQDNRPSSSGLKLARGYPETCRAFHDPDALRAILRAFTDASTSEGGPAGSVYTGISDGVTASLTSTHLGVHIDQKLPATYSIDYAGSVKLTGRERRAAEADLRQSFFFPIETR